MEEYDRLGIHISNVEYYDSYQMNDSSWVVCVQCMENYPDGSSQRVCISFDGDSLYSDSHRLADKWTGDILYICDTISMRVENDVMGYRDYKPDFELAQGEKAAITWKGSSKNLSRLEWIMLVNTSYGVTHPIDISPKLFAKKGLQISVPGKYALLGWDGDKTVCLADDVEIQYSKIKNYEQ